MKKRLLSLFLTFSMLLTFFPVSTVTVFASDSPMAYTDGSYQFILNADNTATITKYTDNEHRITIPAQVTQGTQTYPVYKNRRPGILQLQVLPDKCPDPRHRNRNWQQCFL